VINSLIEPSVSGAALGDSVVLTALVVCMKFWPVLVVLSSVLVRPFATVRPVIASASGAGGEQGRNGTGTEQEINQR